MKQTGEAGVPANKQYSASTPVQKTGYTIRAAIGRLRKIQMKPSEKILAVLLPLTPFVGFGLFWAIAFTLHGRGAINFTFLYVFLGWIFSVACGFYAAKRKETQFKIPLWGSIALLVLLPLTFVSVAATIFHDFIGTYYALFSCAVWCLASICITLTIIVREAWNEANDAYTHIIFFTQVCWACSSFFFLYMVGGVSA